MKLKVKKLMIKLRPWVLKLYVSLLINRKRIRYVLVRQSVLHAEKVQRVTRCGEGHTEFGFRVFYDGFIRRRNIKEY